MRLAKRKDFADLPAEFLMFSGLFFLRTQNIDIQWFVFVLDGRLRPAKIRLEQILMVCDFFDDQNSALERVQNLRMRLGE